MYPRCDRMGSPHRKGHLLHRGNHLHLAHQPIRLRRFPRHSSGHRSQPGCLCSEELQPLCCALWQAQSWLSHYRKVPTDARSCLLRLRLSCSGCNRKPQNCHGKLQPVQRCHLLISEHHLCKCSPVPRLPCKLPDSHTLFQKMAVRNVRLFCHMYHLHPRCCTDPAYPDSGRSPSQSVQSGYHTASDLLPHQWKQRIRSYHPELD